MLTHAKCEKVDRVKALKKQSVSIARFYAIKEP